MMDWCKFRVAEWIARHGDMSDEERGRDIWAFCMALILRKRDLHPLADRALDEQDEVSQKARESIKQRWRHDEGQQYDRITTVLPSKNDRNTVVIQNKNKSKNINSETEVKKRKVRLEGEHNSLSVSVSVSEKKKEKKTVGGKTGMKNPDESMQDPKEAIARAEGAMLPRLMAAFCGESGQSRTKNTFAKAMREMGVKAFREKARQFVEEVLAGEEPDNRGAAFTARLTAKGKRGSRKTDGNVYGRGRRFPRASNYLPPTPEDLEKFKGM